MTELDASDTIELSVAIVAYHSDRRLLGATLAGLAAAVGLWRARYAPGAHVSVMLIDNGAATAPLPPPAQLVAPEVLAAFDACALHPMEHNLGYGRAHNTVLTRGAGRFHLVLNPDLEMDRDALCVGIEYLERHADVVCVVPEARDERGMPLYLAKRYPSLLVLMARALGRYGRRIATGKRASYEMRDVCAAGLPAEVSLASGCFMLLRGAAFARVGGFSSRYFLYFEDFDLSLRLGRSGRIVYLPTMRVLHHGGGAAAKGVRHILLFCRSAARFFSTHGWRLR